MMWPPGSSRALMIVTRSGRSYSARMRRVARSLWLAPAIAVVAISAFGAPPWPATAVAAAVSTMRVEQQNALVQRHCAVCHTDRARNGGLSLQHFDAARVSPSLAAMMLSKITSGRALHTVARAATEPDAATALAAGVKAGAMNAAGLPWPDKDAMTALIAAFAAQANGAGAWHLERTEDAATRAPLLTASILREVPSGVASGRPPDIEAALYRLVVTCNTANREGEMQLAWSPIPKRGTLTVAADEQAAVAHTVEGTETMGNGSTGTTGHAAAILVRSTPASSGSTAALPSRSLTVGGLFPGETVRFPFGDMTAADRGSLSACFR